MGVEEIARSFMLESGERSEDGLRAYIRGLVDDPEPVLERLKRLVPYDPLAQEFLLDTRDSYDIPYEELAGPDYLPQQQERGQEAQQKP